MEVRELIYENKLASEADIRDFRLEGQAGLSFPNGRLRMENALDSELGQAANFVFWCPVDFPDSIAIEWEFRPLREPGLSMLFFAASGTDGEDLFDRSLQERSGRYEHYTFGDIRTMHLSYFRRRYPEERAFHTCNLRKSSGFHLVAQGADPIPDVVDCDAPYRLALKKQGARISFSINDLHVLDWTDDGHTYGPALSGGKIGFRQMAPLVAEYANFAVYRLRT